MSGVTTAAVIPAAALQDRSPEQWLDDVRWHRRMFAQSHFRWAPEDPLHIALDYSRGRVLFETPAHLRSLDDQLMDLREWKGQITDAMAAPLRQARSRYTRSKWEHALGLIGLTEYDARVLIGSAHQQTRANPDVRRALRGYPLPNPLTNVWELRQMESMYQAAEALLEDALCDLVVELAPHHGWANLAALTVGRTELQLRFRLERQQQERGPLGDPRRTPGQRYPLQDP